MKAFCKIHGLPVQMSYTRAQKVTKSLYFETLSHYIWTVIMEDPVVLLAHYLTQIIPTHLLGTAAATPRTRVSPDRAELEIWRF